MLTQSAFLQEALFSRTVEVGHHNSFSSRGEPRGELCADHGDGPGEAGGEGEPPRACGEEWDVKGAKTHFVKFIVDSSFQIYSFLNMTGLRRCLSIWLHDPGGSQIQLC